MNAHAKEIDQIKSAHVAGQLADTTVANIKRWLIDEAYADYRPILLDHIRQKQWATLQDVFWTTIPFGTAGRRGRMHPIGTNAINERTIGETIQALAEYVQDVWEGPRPASVAIAYDTRHQSDSFAKLCAEIMVAHGFHVYFFEGFRSTPLLATTVRYKQCACGIMVSASHNPPTDNAAKVFWSTGGQLRSPHDAAVTKRMESVGKLKRTPFTTAIADGKIEYVAEEMDVVYRDAVTAEGFGRGQGNRDLKVIYSPLHGVGLTSVMPVLAADGFNDVEVFAPHGTPSGCFPNVPNNVANPENPAVFDAIAERAKEVAADIIIASDPDADRLGCSTPLKFGGDQWQSITGNQLAVLLTEYVLRQRKKAGVIKPGNYIVKTLVTSDMIVRVAESYGIAAHGNCLTGFKWIGSLVDEIGPENFVLGAEEAHGYLIGTHCRDKDGSVAAMLLAEMADDAKKESRTLHEELDLLFLQHGLHCERTIAKTMPGADGMRAMQSIMTNMRTNPPRTFGGLQLTRLRDYQAGLSTLFNNDTSGHSTENPTEPLTGPQGNVLLLDTDQPGNYVAVRPSGTEPKIKFYLFTRLSPEDSQDLPAARTKLIARLDAMQSDLLSGSET